MILKRQVSLHALTETIITRDLKWKLPISITKSKNSTKDPIILIQGWTGGIDDWGVFSKILSITTNRPVIAYDARGIGNSQFVDGIGSLRDLDIATMQHDAQSVLNFGLDMFPGSAVVLGVSMGSVVGAKVVEELLHSSDVSHLILASSIDNKFIPPEKFKASIHNWSECDIASAQQAEDFFRLGLGPHFLSQPGYSKQSIRFAKKFVQAKRKSMDGILAQKLALERFDMPNLETIGANKNVLVLHGSDDLVSTTHVGLGVANRVGSDLVVVPNAGHLMWLTHPLDLAEHVATFIR